MIFYREIETKMRKLRKKNGNFKKWSDPNLKELIPIRIISKVDFYINNTYYSEWEIDNPIELLKWEQTILQLNISCKTSIYSNLKWFHSEKFISGITIGIDSKLRFSDFFFFRFYNFASIYSIKIMIAKQRLKASDVWPFDFIHRLKIYLQFSIFIFWNFFFIKIIQKFIWPYLIYIYRFVYNINRC